MLQSIVSCWIINFKVMSQTSVGIISRGSKYHARMMNRKSYVILYAMESLFVVLLFSCICEGTNLIKRVKRQFEK